MSAGESAALRFGRFVLDADGRLRHGRKAIPIAPKEIGLLRVLAEAEGRLVSKQEIFDRLWPGQDVGEASITRCVRGLRRALGEGGRRGGTIETEHGRGYRLAVAVESARGPGQAESARPLRIGVGPFDDASPGGANEYLARGLSGDLTDRLARYHADGLTVIARQSAQRLQRGTPRLFRLARELRLDLVLTGWLQFEGDEICVRVELVRTSDESLAWSADFRRSHPTVPRLAREIVEAVARQLRPVESARTSKPAEQRSPPRSRSYLALFQGQFASQLRTERGIRRGIELFQQAITWDPGNAEAHAAIADAYLFLGFRGYAAPLEIAADVRGSVMRALAIDRQLVPALASLAYLRWAIDLDPRAALRAVERASAVEPGNARIEWMRGQIHLSQGRFDDALAAYTASIDVDPFSPSTAASVPFTLLCARRLDEALAAARAMTERDPDFGLGHGIRAAVAAALGRREEAIRSAESAERLARGDQLTLSGCVWALAVAGRSGHAAAIRSALEQKASRRYVGPSYLAASALALGDAEAAMAWLQQGLEQRCMFLPLVAVDPRFGPLHGNARFEAITAAARGLRAGPGAGARERSAMAARAKTRASPRHRDGDPNAQAGPSADPAERLAREPRKRARCPLRRAAVPDQ